MKTLITMFAAVVITTSAFAKATTINKFCAAQTASTVSTTLSISGNGSYLNKSSRRARRHLKLLSKNPFRIVSLSRGSRY